jgi:hypothetical protein
MHLQCAPSQWAELASSLLNTSPLKTFHAKCCKPETAAAYEKSRSSLGFFLERKNIENKGMI